MFSHCYQIGESIEIFNCQDRKLFSKWGFAGKHSKVYDPNLHAYEMVLSTGNLSKMEMPKNSFNNSKNKALSIFQGFIVFQLYLFTSKGLTIEIAISDTTNAKRRLIFSSNNSDLVINQLHCRIPIFKFPIGRWVNCSIDILSFVSKCYKDLTFRSVDYISLSMSGKVRYIFTMRTPIIELNNSFELDDEGNIINNNNNSNIELDINDSNSKIRDNSENILYSPGAKDIPDKYKFPPHEEITNMNIDCNKVFSQIYIENENKRNMLSQKDLYKSPILIQDTADAHNMDKSLKFRHQIYKNNQKRMNIKQNDYFNGIHFSEDEFKTSNNNDYIAKNNKMNFLKNNPKSGTYDKQINRFNKVGNLIMSHNINNHNNLNKNYVNKKSTYNFERNNINLNMNMNDYRDININNDANKNELINEKEFINLSNENNNNDRYDNNNERYDLFNKEEYNKLYNKGQGLTSQIKKNLNLNNNNDKIIDFDEKLNQISTIRNDNLEMIENFEYNNNFDLENGIIENEKNIENMMNDDGRPFSPPITKLEEGEF